MYGVHLKLIPKRGVIKFCHKEFESQNLRIRPENINKWSGGISWLFIFWYLHMYHFLLMIIITSPFVMWIAFQACVFAQTCPSFGFANYVSKVVIWRFDRIFCDAVVGQSANLMNDWCWEYVFCQSSLPWSETWNSVALPLHPVPGRANFRRDFFRGSVFVIMTILRGTILAQVHHHFPNSH